MDNAISDYDSVVLLADIPSEGLRAGQTGAVVLIHGLGEAFEVEFPIDLHNSIVATVRRDQILKLRGLKYEAKAG